MNELSLFTGAGGGVLGSKILGWKTIGYVEKDQYCQNIILQRIQDGIFDDAPIFADVKLFIQQGFADLYSGHVDVVSAGFPCQPFSVAGKRGGADDARNMWPETIECIRRIRPSFALLENVPGLLATNYFWKILADLCESGFDARWDIIGASDVGANHRRKRLWILAYTNKRSGGPEPWKQQKIRPEILAGMRKERKSTMADTKSIRRDNGFSTNIGEAGGKGHSFSNSGTILGDTTGQGCGNIQGRAEISECAGSGTAGGANWWTTEPAVGRVAHGVAHRVDRLRAIGNGQVPITMAYAFSKLSEGIIGGQE